MTICKIKTSWFFLNPTATTTSTATDAAAIAVAEEEEGETCMWLIVVFSLVSLLGCLLSSCVRVCVRVYGLCVFFFLVHNNDFDI